MNNEEVQTNEKTNIEVKPKKTRSYNGLYRKNARSARTKDSSTEVVETIQPLTETSSEELKNNDKPEITNNHIQVAYTEIETEPKNKNPVVTIKAGTKSKRLTASPKVNPNQKKKKIKGNDASEDTPNITSHPKAETSEDVVTHKRNPYHEVLFLIRQKYAYNHNEFFIELEKVLQEQEVKFSEIEDSNLSLFGFAFLYERDFILNGLCEKYPEEITQSDLERTFKYCFNKRSETMTRLISLYSSKFVPSNDFISYLFNIMSICSYRSEINTMLLNWLTPFCTEENVALFWDKCIENKNHPLMQAGTDNQMFKSYMNLHFSEYEERLKVIGRDFSIRTMLGKKTPTVQTVFTDVQMTPTTYLGNEAEQQKQNNQMLNQNDKKTVVVFKNKKPAE